jgi:hypothetical protein
MLGGTRAELEGDPVLEVAGDRLGAHFQGRLAEHLAGRYARIQQIRNQPVIGFHARQRTRAGHHRNLKKRHIDVRPWFVVK